MRSIYPLSGAAGGHLTCISSHALRRSIPDSLYLLSRPQPLFSVGRARRRTCDSWKCVPSLAALALASNRVLLADGAPAPLFQSGLVLGEPPEFWTTDRPERSRTCPTFRLMPASDLISDNTFVCQSAPAQVAKQPQDRDLQACHTSAELAS